MHTAYTISKSGPLDLRVKANRVAGLGPWRLEFDVRKSRIGIRDQRMYNLRQTDRRHNPVTIEKLKP